MIDLSTKQYVVVVQCHLVKQRCSGYFCEKAFHERSGGFALYPPRPLRTLYTTCGGCCGRAVQRKLGHLVRQLRKQEQLSKEQIVVQLSSCMTNDNLHGPPCPHLEYIRTLIARLGLDLSQGTHISAKSEERRREGVYLPRQDG